jgi:hypothetical protein
MFAPQPGIAFGSRSPVALLAETGGVHDAWRRHQGGQDYRGAEQSSLKHLNLPGNMAWKYGIFPMRLPGLLPSIDHAAYRPAPQPSRVAPLGSRRRAGSKFYPWRILKKRMAVVNTSVTPFEAISGKSPIVTP